MVDATISFLPDAKKIAGNKFLDVSDFKFVIKSIKFTTTDGKYATGGLPLDLRKYSKDGKTEPLFILFQDSKNMSYAYKYDSANHKVLIYDLSAGSQIANSVTLENKTFDMFLIYK